MVRGKVDFETPLAHGQIRDKWRPDRISQDVGDEWREYAECIGADPRLFTLESPEETKLYGAGLNKRYNEDKFAIAWTYCDNCQVKTACRLDALRRGDHAITVRGGMNPYDVAPTPHTANPRESGFDLDAAFAAYRDGKVMHKVRRAGKGPESGPWPSWSEFLRGALAELPQGAYKGSKDDPPRNGWVLGPGEASGTVRFVMQRGDTYERKTIYRSEILPVA